MTDPSGFVANFESLFSVAYRASFVILGDRADAEDCAQEALARAMVRWRRVEDHAEAWVARVAANQAIDHVRSRHRIEPIDVDDGSTATGLVSARADLVRALRALPRRQREAVVLRHLLDLSETDTAAAMGCRIGTVKSAASRGLSTLRTQLGPSYAWEEP